MSRPDDASAQHPLFKPGFYIGLALFILMHVAPPPEGLSSDGWAVAALAALMATWWVTEAIPLPATGLLPLIVMPLTTELSMKQVVAPPYASTVVLLFVGGLAMARGVERWRLHERIALNVVARVGDHPRALLAGFMAATAVLSMWISNTAAAVMMVPIVMSAAREGGDHDGVLARALLLGVAYSASIGGVATPIGTPTNAIALDFLRKAGAQEIGFFEWMMFGLPAAALMLPAAWFVLTTGGVGKLGHMEAASDVIQGKLARLGGMRTPELRVALVFGFIAFLWMARSVLQQIPGLEGLSDTGIAIFGAVLMMALPAGDGKGGRILTWEDAESIPWGMLILFGGGLSLAACMQATDLSHWLGEQLSFLESAPGWLVVLVVVAFVIFLTELTSNVATTSTIMPILQSIAIAASIPFAALAGPAAVAASCAFMLPVATAPNAIVYASGGVSLGQMMKAGFRINLIGVIVLTLVGVFLAPAALS